MANQPPVPVSPFTVDYPRQVDLRSLQVAYERLNSLQKQLNSIPVANLTDAQLAQVKSVIGQTASQAITASGSHPVPITTLPGATTYVSPAVSDAITSGSAAAVTAALLSGTHASRPAAASVTPPVLYFETDRTVFYELIGGQWTYTSGIMFAATASRPTDLGVPDTGFLFHDTTHKLTYRWSGSAWSLLITYQPVIADTYANWTTATYNPATYANGQQFLVTDRNLTYTVESGLWTYTSGLYIAPAASRPTTGFNGAPLGSLDIGLEFLASDTGAYQYWSGSAWVTIGGSGAPTGPAGGDLGGTYPDPFVQQTSGPGNFTIMHNVLHQPPSGGANYYFNITPGAGMGFTFLESGVGVGQLSFSVAGSTYLDYEGNWIIRAGYGGPQVAIFDTGGNLVLFQLLRLPGMTVASLPPPQGGYIAHITDAVSPVVGSPVVGGGSAQCLVWHNSLFWSVFAV